MTDTATQMLAALPGGIDLGDERAVMVALINTGLWRANEIYVHLDEVIESAREAKQIQFEMEGVCT